MTITRKNSLGLTYIISDNKLGGVTIRCGNGKKMLIGGDVTTDQISQCWYNWQMRGLKVQHAFHTFTNSQREFLMTGITPEEWDEMWKEVVE